MDSYKKSFYKRIFVKKLRGNIFFLDIKFLIWYYQVVKTKLQGETIMNAVLEMKSIINLLSFIVLPFQKVLSVFAILIFDNLQA